MHVESTKNFAYFGEFMSSSQNFESEPDFEEPTNWLKVGYGSDSDSFGASGIVEGTTTGVAILPDSVCFSHQHLQN